MRSTPSHTTVAPAARQPDHLAAWLRMEQTPGVGGVTARLLLERFGSPDGVFAAGFTALREHVDEAIALALCEPLSDATARLIDVTLDWLAQASHYLLTLHDAAYPHVLAHIPDPPPLLYVQGRIELLAGPSMAIVGSRNASAQGVANAEAFGRALSCAGLTIVSGMALGIDTAAHLGGLAGIGSTVAVVGTGVDRIYPPRNRALAYRIADEGCVVSEFALGTPVSQGNFPRRNRVISGLAVGVLVVEAAIHSGSLITARVAGAQGRDVFAIPGSIHATLSKGCHKLIREGAMLVESAADVLGALWMSPLVRAAVAAPAAAAAGNENEGGDADAEGDDDDDDGADAGADAGSGDPHAALLAALGHDPVGADALSARTGAEAGYLISQLLALELAGQVERLPGGLFQRVHC